MDIYFYFYLYVFWIVCVHDIGNFRTTCFLLNWCCMPSIFDTANMQKHSFRKNLFSIQAGKLGINFPISWTRRTQNVNKNQNYILTRAELLILAKRYFEHMWEVYAIFDIKMAKCSQLVISLTWINESLTTSLTFIRFYTTVYL